MYLNFNEKQSFQFYDRQILAPTRELKNLSSCQPAHLPVLMRRIIPKFGTIDLSPSVYSHNV